MQGQAIHGSSQGARRKTRSGVDPCWWTASMKASGSSAAAGSSMPWFLIVRGSSSPDGHHFPTAHISGRTAGPTRAWLTIPEIPMTPTALLYLLARQALPVLWSQMTNEVGLNPEDAYTLLARGIADSVVGPSECRPDRESVGPQPGLYRYPTPGRPAAESGCWILWNGCGPGRAISRGHTDGLPVDPHHLPSNLDPPGPLAGTITRPPPA